MRLKFVQNAIDTVRGKRKSKHFQKFKKNFEDYLILKDKSLDIEIPDDLILHLGFNANCNCRCKFCSQGDQRFIKKELIDQDLLYKYLLPLYPKTKFLIPTQGEITCVSEGYDYLKWIDENYPQINISIESNGIAFNEKWQDLAVKNLMNVHFSVNAISNETFLRTVWGDVGGEKVFEKIEKNITGYIQKLKDKGLDAFIPSVSCVLNSTNYYETVQFIEKMLEWGANKINLYFDTRENDVRGKGTIKDKDGFMFAINSLIELEKLLSGKAYLDFKLFMPYDDVESIEKKVEAISLDELKNKYQKIYELSKEKNYNILHNVRNKIRISKNKLTFTPEEEEHITWHNGCKFGKKVCLEPWKHIRIRTNGFINVCSWRGYSEEFKIQDFIKNGKINWNDIFNGVYYKKLRKNFLNGDYSGCMHNCPGIPKHLR